MIFLSVGYFFFSLGHIFLSASTDTHIISSPFRGTNVVFKNLPPPLNTTSKEEQLANIHSIDGKQGVTTDSNFTFQ